MAIGETGSLTRGGFGATEEVRIDFGQAIDNPVVMLTATNNGGNEFSLIVTSVDNTGFTFRLAEWEDEDGPHPATETINWMAVTPGVHSLPDGRIIEAGTTTATTTASSVTLNGSFTAPPVILTNRMSENDPDVADSDPSNITASSFDVSLQEGALSDGVNTGETVGYIAISPGGDGATSGTAQTYDTLTTGNSYFSLDHNFANGITLAETQTLNEADAGNVHLRNENIDDQVRAYFDEETGDGSGAHVPESVGFVTFEEGLIPCFTPGTEITTARGQVDVDALTPGDLILTRDSGFQPLRWLSRTELNRERLDADPNLRPILIRKGSIAPGIPAADMAVSPQHRMLVSGWRVQTAAGETEAFVSAKALVDGKFIRRTSRKRVVYYHLLLDRHHVIYANGAASESLHADQLDKAELTQPARSELFDLFPDLRSFGSSFGPSARPTLRNQQARAMVLH